MSEVAAKTAHRHPASCRLSQRIGRIKPSPTSMAAQRARALRAEGRPIISLTTGEPDTATPDFVLDAANRAMREGQTRYTNTGGTDELRSAIQAKFRRDNNLQYAGDQVMAATGGKQIIFNALMTTVDYGDEVIIPAPYWVSYPDVVSLAGGIPRIVESSSSSGFRVSADALRAAITPKSRWLILNSPNNPSGATYRARELSALADVLREAPHLWVLSDDIYEHITFRDEGFCTLASIAPDLADRVLIVNGVSKAYSMTGWRLGYCAGPAELIKAMTKLQSQSTSSPCAVSQAAAAAALNGPQDIVAQRTAKLCARRDRLLPLLQSVSGFECPKPEGAFYFYIAVGELIGRRTPSGEVLNGDDDVVRYFLESHDVAVVAGSGFGLSPCIRISFAAADELLDEAVDRMRQACAALD